MFTFCKISGHATHIAISVMTIQWYIKSWKQKLIFWILGILGWFVIIASKFHYTIDVEIAIALVVITWHWYHQIVSEFLNFNKYQWLYYLESLENVENDFLFVPDIYPSINNSKVIRTNQT